ncbi:MAG TPA: 50S ribosomal protein L32 [Candidatus Nitrosotenuis sp.]|jgi:large subunit ribosomal protein L32|nr:50S ribosomal protein L32 [Candidatus Nitrosotenuis sp.]
MANPKYKTPRSKTRKRRSHLRLEVPNVVECPHCHEPKLPHRVCPSCGQYKGREVFKLSAGGKS